MKSLILRQVMKTAKADAAALAAASADETRRASRLANREDFYLRTLDHGYNWGANNDPDNLLPTKK